MSAGLPVWAGPVANPDMVNSVERGHFTSIAILTPRYHVRGKQASAKCSASKTFTSRKQASSASVLLCLPLPNLRHPHRLQWVRWKADNPCLLIRCSNPTPHVPTRLTHPSLSLPFSARALDPPVSRIKPKSKVANSPNAHVQNSNVSVVLARHRLLEPVRL